MNYKLAMDAHSEFLINKETEVVTSKTSLLFINTVKTTKTANNNKTCMIL